MTLNFTHKLSGALTAATLLGAVLALSPLAAMAQAAPANQRVEARIKSLHASLHITAAEQPQWQAVADAMRDNASTTGALIKDREAHAKTMTAVDDLHSYEGIADAHASGVKKLTTAFETLYGSLSDAQKKDADAAFRHQERPMAAKKAG